MAKAPVPGTVKTRLGLPPGEAARLQEALIPDAVEKALSVGPVAVAGIPSDRLGLISALLPDEIRIIPQAGGDLGERMLSGARILFEESSDPIIILGADSPTLPPAHLTEAARALKNHDAVIVPSTDGGYVLLGLRGPHEALFRNIAWSTEAVYGQTLERAREAGLTVHECESWYDVDTPEDLQRLRRDLAASRDPAPRTARLLRGW